MIKVNRIVKVTTLMMALGFVMIIWAHGRPAPSPQGSTDSKRLVKLRLTFESGDWASVTQFEGGTIRIEKNGKKLAISPYIREQGQVELRVFQAVQRDGKEAMDAVGTLLVGKDVTKLERGGLLTSIQVLDANKKLPAEVIAAAAGGSTCCATTCAGTVICGVCVCTDCQRCGPRWCECAMP